MHSFLMRLRLGHVVYFTFLLPFFYFATYGSCIDPASLSSVHVQIVSAQIVSAQLVSAHIVSAQIVSGTNCIGNKLYREHIVSGTNCIGNKLYRAQIVSAPFHFFTLSKVMSSKMDLAESRLIR
jgi:hypothetical protein